MKIFFIFIFLNLWHKFLKASRISFTADTVILTIWRISGYLEDLRRTVCGYLYCMFLISRLSSDSILAKYWFHPFGGVRELL